MLSEGLPECQKSWTVICTDLKAEADRAESIQDWKYNTGVK